MGEMIAAPDRDPFAFSVQRRLSHCNITHGANTTKKPSASAIIANFCTAHDAPYNPPAHQPHLHARLSWPPNKNSPISSKV